MGKIITCPRCKGAKTIIGIGMVEVDCPECDGTGSKFKTEEELKPKKDKKQTSDS